MTDVWGKIHLKKLLLKEKKMIFVEIVENQTPNLRKIVVTTIGLLLQI
jgi:hypothetical protein